MPKVRKAILAAAGLGTRFLPQTKAMPKEMLPLVDKPIIQYVVEELVDAGIEDIIIVSGYSKRAIEDHFDLPSQELINYLKEKGKKDLITEIEAIADLANFVYIRQKGPMGSNATPLLNAEHLIGAEPFIYCFADDFVLATPSRFKQLIAAYEKHGGNLLTCVRANREHDFKRYGYVGGQSIDDGLISVSSIIEKPGSKEASPSDLASVGGYIFDPIIFKFLHDQRAGLEPGQEFVIQVAMQKMIESGQKLYGCEIQDGRFYDAGNKLDYLKTVVDFALMNEEIKADFASYLRGLEI